MGKNGVTFHYRNWFNLQSFNVLTYSSAVELFQCSATIYFNKEVLRGAKLSKLVNMRFM